MEAAKEVVTFDLHDPNVEERLVNLLKEQGVFDQLRKDCLADVDTKPGYQNLKQRVDSTLDTFIKANSWKPTLNKNQLRAQLRKAIEDLSGKDTVIDRLVDQIVDPKLKTAIYPEVEAMIEKYIGSKLDDSAENVEMEDTKAFNGGSPVNMQETADGTESDDSGPGLEGQISPITPGREESSPKMEGSISPLTPSNTPPLPAVVDMEVETQVELPPGTPPDSYTPPPKQESYTPPPPRPVSTPPLPAAQVAPPPLPSPKFLFSSMATPPPPPGRLESGGEASMSSISDTEIGDMSPPHRSPPSPDTSPTRHIPLPPQQEARVTAHPPGTTPPPQPAATPSSHKGTGSDSELDQLEKMRAELMARLEGDFKLSPEEEDSESEGELDTDEEKRSAATASDQEKSPKSDHSSPEQEKSPKPDSSAGEDGRDSGQDRDQDDASGGDGSPGSTDGSPGRGTHPPSGGNQEKDEADSLAASSDSSKPLYDDDEEFVDTDLLPLASATIQADKPRSISPPNQLQTIRSLPLPPLAPENTPSSLPQQNTVSPPPKQNTPPAPTGATPEQLVLFQSIRGPRTPEPAFSPEPEEEERRTPSPKGPTTPTEPYVSCEPLSPPSPVSMFGTRHPGGGTWKPPSSKELFSKSSSSDPRYVDSSKNQSSPFSSQKDKKEKQEKKSDKIKEQQKAKLAKVEQKVMSKYKLKSDKYQDLDIFSTTKKTSTPHQPYRPPSVSGGTPSTAGGSAVSTPTLPNGGSQSRIKPNEFNKKLNSSLREAAAKMEQERSKGKAEFTKPDKIPDRRGSADSRESSKDDKKPGKHSSRESSKDKESHSRRASVDVKEKPRHKEKEVSKERSKEKDREREKEREKEKDRDKVKDKDKERKEKSKQREKERDKEKEREKSKVRRESEDDKKPDLSKQKERDSYYEDSRKRLAEMRQRKEKEEREKKGKGKEEKKKKDTADVIKEQLSSLGVDEIRKLLKETLDEKAGPGASKKILSELGLINKRKEAEKRKEIVLDSDGEEEDARKKSSSRDDSEEERNPERKKKRVERLESSDSEIEEIPTAPKSSLVKPTSKELEKKKPTPPLQPKTATPSNSKTEMRKESKDEKKPTPSAPDSTKGSATSPRDKQGRKSGLESGAVAPTPTAGKMNTRGVKVNLNRLTSSELKMYNEEDNSDSDSDSDFEIKVEHVAIKDEMPQTAEASGNNNPVKSKSFVNSPSMVQSTVVEPPKTSKPTIVTKTTVKSIVIKSNAVKLTNSPRTVLSSHKVTDSPRPQRKSDKDEDSGKSLIIDLKPSTDAKGIVAVTPTVIAGKTAGVAGKTATVAGTPSLVLTDELLIAPGTPTAKPSPRRRSSKAAELTPKRDASMGTAKPKARKASGASPPGASPPVSRAVSEEAWHGFEYGDIAFMLGVKDNLANLVQHEDTLSVSSISSEELNSHIPATKHIEVELPSDCDQVGLLQLIDQLGGGAKVSTTIPQWLKPYIIGARLKSEELEMPSRDELATYLAKSQKKGKKRGGGYDIVVEWVDLTPGQKKGSRAERELKNDPFSTFFSGIAESGGKRARRANNRYSSAEYTANGEFDLGASPADNAAAEAGKAKEVAEEKNIPGISKESMKEEATKVKSSKERIQAYLKSAGVERVLQPDHNSPPELPAPTSATPTETRPTPTTNTVTPTIGPEDTPSRAVRRTRTKNTSGDTSINHDVQALTPVNQDIPAVKPANQDIPVVKPANRVTSREPLSNPRTPKDTLTNHVTNGAGRTRTSRSEKGIEAGKGAEAQGRMSVDEELKATNEEMEKVLQNLKKGKEKFATDQGEFYGWTAADIPAALTAISLLSGPGGSDCTLMDGGAKFGLLNLDILGHKLFPVNEGKESSLEIVVSPAILRDMKKAEQSTKRRSLSSDLRPDLLRTIKDDLDLRNGSDGSDSDEKGSSSPSSCGSSKENEPSRPRRSIQPKIFSSKDTGSTETKRGQKRSAGAALSGENKKLKLQ